MEIRLHVHGDRACFKRVEFARDLISYDVITPLAARGLFEGIYATPDMRWRIEEIRVLRPIRSTWMSLAQTEGVAWIVGGERDRRMANVLVDVAYVLTARLETGGPEHLAMFRRRVADARFVRAPYLGLPAFAATVEEAGDAVLSGHPAGAVDLGWMLYDVPDDGSAGPRLFRPTMIDGVIDLRRRESLILAG